MLEQLIRLLPSFDSDKSFGNDIDEIHKNIFEINDKVEIEKIFRHWSSLNQPCVFGKLASRKINKLDYHLTIIDKKLLTGDGFELFRYMQQERIIFKDRAIKGDVSAHLIYFIHRSLAYAKPSEEFLALQKILCGLHMPEFNPIQENLIYKESIPLKTLSGYEIFKAGTNVFYTCAHGTRNHDRRIPGGFLISINSPGHYFAVAMMNGVYTDADEGLKKMTKMMAQSIGKGGIGHPNKISTTWHDHSSKNRKGCPILDEQSAYYSGFYHTDVLLPGELTKDSRTLEKIDDDDPMIFNWNDLFYMSSENFDPNHPDYGEFKGIPVGKEAIYFNPFPPRIYEKGPME